MKLPQLLSQYLYQTRKIDLPGIGSFTLDPAVVIPQETDRIGQIPAIGISFKNANISVPDDALVNFIKEHTGKMKSLAAADLDFYLTTGKQLLNIGKPFYLEGIGTLIKNKEGHLDFTPGDYMVARLDEHHPNAERKATSFDEPPRDHDGGQSSNTRQTLLLVGLIGGLIVIGWGGYYLYKRNTFVEPATENRATVVADSPRASSADTSQSPGSNSPTPPAGDVGGKAGDVSGKTGDAGGVKEDLSGVKPAVVTPAPVPTEGQSLYRFVILETENKYRALRRYNQLLGYQLNIKMDQKDSIHFKLYFPIAAAIKDTTHIKDSLADVYAAPHVRIEH